MAHERMLDKATVPTDAQMLAWTAGAAAHWQALRDEAEERFGMPPEVSFGGAKYGWQIRYRKGGRTLCTLFPERDAVTVLIVLGAKEVAKVTSVLDTLSPAVREAFERAGQYADGRWMWPRVLAAKDVQSIGALLAVKRRPLR